MKKITVILLFVLFLQGCTIFWPRDAKDMYQHMKENNILIYENKEDLTEYKEKMKNILEKYKVEYTYKNSPVIDEHSSYGVISKEKYFGYYYIFAEIKVKDKKTCVNIEEDLKVIPIESYYMVCEYDKGEYVSGLYEDRDN